MKRNKIYLSIVIPCYNEEANLKRGILNQVENYLSQQKYSSEVLISDDGSTDASLSFIKKFIQNHPRFKLLKNPHGGKPFAVRAGINAAQGKIILFTDMDQSAPLNQIEKFLPYFKKDFDVIIGSRGKERVGFSIFRQLASNVFRLLRQRLLLGEITDTQCGFKAFKKEVAQDLFSRLLIFEKAKKIKGWRVGAFDVELLFLAQKQGYQIAEVPIQWENKDIGQAKKRKFFKESVEMFKEIVRVKINDLFGRYNS